MLDVGESLFSVILPSGLGRLTAHADERASARCILIMTGKRRINKKALLPGQFGFGYI